MDDQCSKCVWKNAECNIDVVENCKYFLSEPKDDEIEEVKSELKYNNDTKIDFDIGKYNEDKIVIDDSNREKVFRRYNILVNEWNINNILEVRKEIDKKTGREFIVQVLKSR
jgi:hypothetical protein